MSKKLSIVAWGDAHASLDQMDENDIRRGHRAHVIHTYGYIVLSNAEGISIAGEWLPSADGDEYEAYRAVTFVPRGMVIEEKPVEAKRRRKIVTPPVA